MKKIAILLFGIFLLLSLILSVSMCIIGPIAIFAEVSDRSALGFITIVSYANVSFFMMNQTLFEKLPIKLSKLSKEQVVVFTTLTVLIVGSLIHLIVYGF